MPRRPPRTPPRSTTTPESPKTRNADDTRARILPAATEEFARNGYGGAWIDAICWGAKANPRMIYHHFTDKDGLYVAVLEKVLSELRNEELKLSVDHSPPIQGLVPEAEAFLARAPASDAT